MPYCALHGKSATKKISMGTFQQCGWECMCAWVDVYTSTVYFIPPLLSLHQQIHHRVGVWLVQVHLKWVTSGRRCMLNNTQLPLQRGVLCHREWLVRYYWVSVCDRVGCHTVTVWCCEDHISWLWSHTPLCCYMSLASILSGSCVHSGWVCVKCSFVIQSCVWKLWWVRECVSENACRWVDVYISTVYSFTSSTLYVASSMSLFLCLCNRSTLWALHCPLTVWDTWQEALAISQSNQYLWNRVHETVYMYMYKYRVAYIPFLVETQIAWGQTSTGRLSPKNSHICILWHPTGLCKKSCVWPPRCGTKVQTP